MISKEQIVEQIKKEMEKRKISQSDLAQELGLSKQYISDIFSLRKCSLDNLLEVAGHFFEIELKLKRKK